MFDVIFFRGKILDNSRIFPRIVVPIFLNLATLSSLNPEHSLPEITKMALSPRSTRSTVSPKSDRALSKGGSALAMAVSPLYGRTPPLQGQSNKGRKLVDRSRVHGAAREGGAVIAS